MKLTLLLTAFAVVFCLPVTAQQYFYLDPTFSTDGYVIPAYPGNDHGNDLILQPDGKILAVGAGSTGCIVNRFLANGSPDVSFGNNGLVTFQFGTGTNTLKGITLQSDGKIVVAGGFSTKIGVARLLPNGALDPTFGTAGKVIANIDNNTPATAVVIDGNGKIVVASQTKATGSNDDRTVVFRFLTNGTLDPAFSGDGIAEVNILPASTFFVETANALLIDHTSGNILVGGWAYDTTNIGFMLYRLTGNGSLDGSFGTNGIVRTFGNEIFDLVQQPDGKIIAAGYTGDNLLENDIVLTRYLPDGNLDATFGTAGIVITDYGFVEANGVALQPDGKIIIAGFYYQCTLIFFCDYHFIIGRYNPDGSIDNTFRPTGFFSKSIGQDEELHKVVVQPNGDILAVGYYENNLEENDMVLLRLTDSLPPTANFNANFAYGCHPRTVNFNESSAGNPSTWQWSFPGGTPATSSERNPIVVYYEPGIYSVTLTVSNSLGTSTYTATDIVTVITAPPADFTYTTNGNEASFMNTTAGITSASWNFGDGNTSTVLSPNHSYLESGTYIVTLTAFNACGSTTKTDSVTVGGSAVTGIRYVNHAATGANNGSSWADAFINLQDAVDAAPPGFQVWVARGVYKPTQHFTGDTSDRYKTFYISKNLALFGGFNGTEAMLSQRNFQNNPTVLSGDLEDNDLDPEGNGVTEQTNQIKGSNSYHVLWIENVDSTMRLDGFTITAGHADGNVFDKSRNGAGIYLNGENTQVRTNPVLANCTFTGNYADAKGGGLYLIAHLNGGASPTVFNCTFQYNNGSKAGGVAIYSSAGGAIASPKFLQCSFLHNSGSFGGAVSNEEISTGTAEANPSFVNCLFDDNNAGFGGAAHNVHGNPSWINCSFTKNVGTFGGAMYIETGSATWTNCSFSKNDANWGGAIRNNANSLTLNNCIIWGNTGDLENNINNINLNAVIQLRHTLIEETACPPGFTCGNGVIFNQNPLFVNATNSNLRLQAASPAINHGDNDAVPAGITADLAGNTRIYNGTVDMGAYEFGATVGTETPSWLQEIRLYPNPAVDFFSVEMNGEAADEVEFTLLASNGQEILRKTADFSAGKLTQRFETADLPAGLYLLRIRSGNQVEFAKILLQR